MRFALVVLLVQMMSCFSTATKWGLLSPDGRFGGCFLVYDNADGAVLLLGEDANQLPYDGSLIHLFNLTTLSWTLASTSGASTTPSSVSFPVCVAWRGNVYVYAGQGALANTAFPPAYDTLYKLDMVNFRWSIEPSSGVQQGGSSGTLWNNLLIVVGGYASLTNDSTPSPSGTPCSTEVMVYDFIARVWTRLTPMIQTTAAFPTGFCLGSMIATVTGRLVFGFGLTAGLGTSSLTSVVSSTLWELDYTHLRFVNLTDDSADFAPQSRAGCVFAYLAESNLIYVQGGFSAQGLDADLISYFNLTSNSWMPTVTVTSAPNAGYFNGAIVHQSKIYAFGAYNELDNKADPIFPVFDLLTSEFLDINRVNDAVYQSLQPVFAAAAVDRVTSRWFMFGGAQAGNYFNTLGTLTAYDMNTNLGSVMFTTGDGPAPYWSGTLTPVDDDHALFVGGMQGFFEWFNVNTYVLNFRNLSWSVLSVEPGLSPMEPNTTVGRVSVFDPATTPYSQWYQTSGVADHTCVWWTPTLSPNEPALVCYGGQSLSFNDGTIVWMLTGVLPALSSSSLANATWSVAPVQGDDPSVCTEQQGQTTCVYTRYGHVATVSGDQMFVFGGLNNGAPFDDLWVLSMSTTDAWIWSALLPAGPTPPARVWAADALLAAWGLWCIFGGNSAQLIPLNDLWCYNLGENIWTEIAHVDPSTVRPQAQYGGRGCTSTRDRDGGSTTTTMYFGPGVQSTTTGLGAYTIQTATLGIRNERISSSTGSDILCQTVPGFPCATLAFSLSHFGGSYMEMTVCQDIGSKFLLDAGLTQISNMVLTSPVILQAFADGAVIDCGGTTCFTLDNIVSSPVTLIGLTVRNGSAINGGVFQMNNARLTLINTTCVDNWASANGGVVYAENQSQIVVRASVFMLNSAGEQGGVFFVQQGSSLTIDVNSQFWNNRAEQSGGVIMSISSSVLLSGSQFKENAIIVSASSSSSALLAGGVLTMIDGQLVVKNCTFAGNFIALATSPNAQQLNLSSPTYGAAIYAYSSSVVVLESVFVNNSAMNGGAIATDSTYFSLAAVLRTVLQPSSILVQHSSFVDNRAWAAGGAFAISNVVTVVLQDCLFENNIATASGGAISANSSNLNIESTVWFNNTCLDGDGGALSLLGLASVFNDCMFHDNKAPFGGGGAIYWAPFTGNGQVKLASSPVLSNTVIVPPPNVSSSLSSVFFGLVWATQPVGLVLSDSTPGYLLNVTAGAVLNLTLAARLIDAYGQTVTNQPSAARAQIRESTATLSGSLTSPTTLGVASFNQIQVQSRPGTSFHMYFTTTWQGQAFSTSSIFVSTAECLPPLYMLDTNRGVCTLCPIRTHTVQAMQTSCQPQLEPNYPVAYTINVSYLVLALVIGVSVSALAVEQAPSYAFGVLFVTISRNLKSRRASQTALDSASNQLTTGGGDLAWMQWFNVLIFMCAATTVAEWCCSALFMLSIEILPVSVGVGGSLGIVSNMSQAFLFGALAVAFVGHVVSSVFLHWTIRPSRSSQSSLDAAERAPVKNAFVIAAPALAPVDRKRSHPNDPESKHTETTSEDDKSKDGGSSRPELDEELAARDASAAEIKYLQGNMRAFHMQDCVCFVGAGIFKSIANAGMVGLCVWSFPAASEWTLDGASVFNRLLYLCAPGGIFQALALFVLLRVYPNGAYRKLRYLVCVFDIAWISLQQWYLLTVPAHFGYANLGLSTPFSSPYIAMLVLVIFAVAVLFWYVNLSGDKTDVKLDALWDKYNHLWRILRRLYSAAMELDAMNDTQELQPHVPAEGWKREESECEKQNMDRAAMIALVSGTHTNPYTHSDEPLHKIDAKVLRWIEQAPNNTMLFKTPLPDHFEATLQALVNCQRVKEVKSVGSRKTESSHLATAAEGVKKTPKTASHVEALSPATERLRRRPCCLRLVSLLLSCYRFVRCAASQVKVLPPVDQPVTVVVSSTPNMHGPKPGAATKQFEWSQFSVAHFRGMARQLLLKFAERRVCAETNLFYGDVKYFTDAMKMGLMNRSQSRKMVNFLFRVYFPLEVGLAAQNVLNVGAQDIARMKSVVSSEVSTMKSLLRVFEPTLAEATTLIVTNLNDVNIVRQREYALLPYVLSDKAPDVLDVMEPDEEGVGLQGESHSVQHISASGGREVEDRSSGPSVPSIPATPIHSTLKHNKPQRTPSPATPPTRSSLRSHKPQGVAPPRDPRAIV